MGRTPRDPYVGTLVNAWLAAGGRAEAVHAGEAYVDTGTVGGYREAIRLLHVAHSEGRSMTTRIASGPVMERGGRGA
jgi:hypothetical protein